MIETTVKVDGMMCGMCEAHVSDAIRGALPVKKVTASHTKGQAVILSEAPLDEETLMDPEGDLVCPHCGATFDIELEGTEDDSAEETDKQDH